MIKVLNAFLAGLAVGILFAPQSGEQTRGKIADVFKDYKEDAKDYLAGAVGTVESKVHTVKEKIKDL